MTFLRLSAAAAVAAALLLNGCFGGRERYLGARVDWRSPVFLDSARVGVFQAAWEEYESSCGYFGDDRCIDLRNIRVHFVAFSPGSGSLDTLFELPKGYDFSIRADGTYAHPYVHFTVDPVHGAYNVVTGEQRKFAHGGSISVGGRYLVEDQWRTSLETGASEAIVPEPWRIRHHDEDKGLALLHRFSGFGLEGRDNVLYDLSTKALDTSRPDVPAVFFAVARGAWMAGEVGAEGSTRLFAIVRREDFDVADPKGSDTLRIVQPSQRAGDRVTDIDPATRRVAREIRFGPWDYRKPDHGLVIADFDGREEHPVFHAVNLQA
jgi:hypothetical protein